MAKQDRMGIGWNIVCTDQLPTNDYISLDCSEYRNTSPRAMMRREVLQTLYHNKVCVPGK